MRSEKKAEHISLVFHFTHFGKFALLKQNDFILTHTLPCTGDVQAGVFAKHIAQSPFFKGSTY